MEKIVYLTIDDSPSIYMEEKINYLYSRNIPAIVFCIGNLIEKGFKFKLPKFNYSQKHPN